MRGTLVALLLTLGCGSPPLEEESADAEAFERELMEADLAFARDTAARGVEAWVETFAKDGKLVGPGAIVEGQDAIREAMGALSRPGYTLEWEPVFAEASSAGDLGYTHGRYRREVVREDGETLVETGTYVTIWRRNARGKLEAVLDVGSPDPE